LSHWQKKVQVLAWRPQSGGHVLRVYSESCPGEGFEPAEPDLEDLYAHRVGGAP
jgi:hypothetical protein